MDLNKIVAKLNKDSAKDKNARPASVHKMNDPLNPTLVQNFISTGSTWLDYIICRGQRGGIPVGRITEIAGLESTGKSYLAMCAAANAQKIGFENIIYFDSEHAQDMIFAESLGVDIDKLNVISADSMELVFRVMDKVLQEGEKTLFIWDSVANTPSESLPEGQFGVNKTIAIEARVASIGMRRLLAPISLTNSALLCINQLRTNISSNPFAMIAEPYFTPHGKALTYAYSLRVWLTRPKSKDFFIEDENGYRIGSTVKAKIKKSRFGSENRSCEFKILWGADKNGVQNDESLFEAVKDLDEFLEKDGISYAFKDGYDNKFKRSNFSKKMKDNKFKTKIYDIMERHYVVNFAKRKGSASSHYDSEDEQVVNEEMESDK